MTKKKSAKRAFISSFMSFVMCFAMLAGTTFAWYTDSVTSSGNKIIAGSLDIQLLKYDGSEYVDISNSGAPIFQSANLAQNNTATLWEPGKTQVAYLRLKNNGNLNLKYSVALDVKNVAKNLYEVMRYAIVKDANNNSPVNAWVPANGIPVEPGTQSTQAVNVPMAPGAVHDFALVIHMQEEAGNEYMAGEVDFDLHVLATQDTVEFDSFSDQYDANAQYPIVSTASFTMSTAPTEDLTVTSTGDIRSATVPQAAAGAVFNNLTDDVPAGSSTEVTLNLNVAKTGETGTPENVTTYLDIDMNAVVKVTSATGDITTTSAAVESLTGYSVIEYFLGTGYDNVIAKHNGNAMDALANADAVPTSAAGGYYYNPTSGILTIKTKSFSPYTVTYNSVAQNTTKGDYYGSMAEAFERASAGDRVALLKAFDAVTATKAVTIDLNGNNVGTLTAAANINVTGNGSVALSVNDGCTATVIGGQHESISFSGEGASVVAGGSYRAANVAAAKAKITASGAYILGPDSSNWHNYTLANGDFLILNPDGTEKALYDTLEDACDNVDANGTIKCIGANTTIPLVCKYQGVDFSTHATLDLNGHTLSVSGNSGYPMFGTNVTSPHTNPIIKNGSIVTSGTGFYIAFNDNAIQLDNVVLNFYPFDKGNHNAMLALPAVCVIDGAGNYHINPTATPTQYKAKLISAISETVTDGHGGTIPVEGNVTYYFTGDNGVAEALGRIKNGDTLEIRESCATTVSTSLALNDEVTITRTDELIDFPTITAAGGDVNRSSVGNTATYSVVQKVICYLNNTTPYYDLQTAVDAMKGTNNSVLKLNSDVVLNSRITIALTNNRKWTFDFNGYTISTSASFSGTSVIYISGGSSGNTDNNVMTFKDSSAGKTGGIYTEKSARCLNIGSVWATTRIEGGNFTTISNSEAVYIKTYKMYVSGGRFYSENGSALYYDQSSTAGATISGGTFISNVSGRYYGIQFPYSKTTLTGGVFREDAFTAYPGDNFADLGRSLASNTNNSNYQMGSEVVETIDGHDYYAVVHK